VEKLQKNKLVKQNWKVLILVAAAATNNNTVTQQQQHLIHNGQALSYLTDIVYKQLLSVQYHVFGPPAAYDMNSRVRD